MFTAMACCYSTVSGFGRILKLKEAATNKNINPYNMSFFSDMPIISISRMEIMNQTFTQTENLCSGTLDILRHTVQSF